MGGETKKMPTCLVDPGFRLLTQSYCLVNFSGSLLHLFQTLGGESMEHAPSRKVVGGVNAGTLERPDR